MPEEFGRDLLSQVAEEGRIHLSPLVQEGHEPSTQTLTTSQPKKMAQLPLLVLLLDPPPSTVIQKCFQITQEALLWELQRPPQARLWELMVRDVAGQFLGWLISTGSLRLLGKTSRPPTTSSRIPSYLCVAHLLSSGDGTQDLVHARQVLYHRAVSPI